MKSRPDNDETTRATVSMNKEAGQNSTEYIKNEQMSR